jgi:hypothetical protein
LVSGSAPALVARCSLMYRWLAAYDVGRSAARSVPWFSSVELVRPDHSRFTACHRYDLADKKPCCPCLFTVDPPKRTDYRRRRTYDRGMYSRAKYD